MNVASSPPSTRFSGRAWLLLGLVLLPLSVVAAPTVFRLLVDLGWIADDGLAFAKVLRRCLLVPIAVLVLGWMRPWRDVGLVGLGLTGPRARPRAGLLAFALTLAALLALLAAQVALGWLRVDVNEGAGRVVWRIVKTLGTGVVVGVLEEWFFRGWLPVRLARRFAPPVAGALAVLLFAAVHAFRPSHLDGAVEPTVAGAFEALGRWGSTLFDPTRFGPAFLGLLLFGTLLLRLYRRTGTLWAPIGVHAAAAWVVFAYGAVTEREATPAWAGGKALYDGPLGWALLLAALGLLALRPPRPPQPSSLGVPRP